jgi:nucleoside-diphosphate-sugar epimerase
MLRGKHLVTGAAGMIGSHLCRRLVDMKCEVVGVDNLLSGSRKNAQDLIGKNGFTLVNNDLRHSSCAINVMKGVDYVWALAANMGGIGYITAVHADIMRDNALVNLNTLEAARKRKVKGYFYSSSACAYSEKYQLTSDVVPLKESDAYPAQPDQSYGWEKIFTEQVCEAYQKDYKMNIRIARFHNVYGTAYTAFDKFKAKAPCHMIIKAIRHPNPEFAIWGDGKATRSFLYIDDCIDGILKLMESDYPNPVNIGSDRLISVDNLAKLVIEISGKSIIPTHDLAKPQGVRGRNADLTLVKQVLGWQPKVSLEEGLKQVYQWAEEYLSELENI